MDNEDSWAITPRWALPAGSAYVFTCQHWYQIEYQWDGGRIEATTDGGNTWNGVTPAGGYNTTIANPGNAAGWPVGTPCFASSTASGWMPLNVALAPFAGTTVRLRFHLSSDPGLTYSGWYLDGALIQ